MRLVTRLLTGLLVIVLTGCATRRPVPQQPYVAPPPVPVVQTIIPPAVDSAFEKGLAQQAKTGKAPVLQVAGVTLYPYADGLVIRCQVMRTCDIEFSEGEEVRRVIVGNPELVSGYKSTSGEGTTQRGHLAIIPSEKGARTNLVVYTNKQAYSLEVIEGSPSVARVGFWFPEEIRQKVTERVAALAKAKGEQRQTNTRYVVSGDASWAPASVFDDGTRVYLLFPENVRVQKMPVLYVTFQGKDALVNYSVQWPYMIVAQLFDQAALVLGVGRSQERVTIKRIE